MNIPRKVTRTETPRIQPQSSSKPSQTSETLKTNVNAYRHSLMELLQHPTDSKNVANCLAEAENIRKNISKETASLHPDQPQDVKDSIKNSIKTEGANSQIVQNIHTQLSKLKNSSDENYVRDELELLDNIHDLLSALYEPVGKPDAAFSSLTPSLMDWLPTILQLLLFSQIPGVNAKEMTEEDKKAAANLAGAIFMIAVTLIIGGAGFFRKDETPEQIKQREEDEKKQKEEAERLVAEKAEALRIQRENETPAERAAREQRERDDEYAMVTLIEQQCQLAMDQYAAQAAAEASNQT